MNEIFAAEPTCFHNESELRGLLKQFGPDTGRYLVAYPEVWRKLVEKNMLKRGGQIVEAGEIGPVQELKIRVMLQRAHEQHRVIAGDPLPYVWNDKPWLEQALKLILPSGRDLDAIVTAEERTQKNVFTLDSLDIPPVADEMMEAQPQEFARVAKTLISISRELIFVDPYANPCKEDVYVVLAALFKLIARSKCTSVVMYARESELTKNHNRSELKASVAKLRKESGLPARCNLELRLVDDQNSPICKLHTRFLFSQKGGIEFDRGFSRLGKGVREPVGPMVGPVLEQAIQCFINSEHNIKDMRVESLHA